LQVLTTTNLMLARLAAQRSTLSIVLLMHAIQLPLYLLLWFFVPEQWSPPPQPYRLAFALPELAVIGGTVLALIVGGFVSQAALANASRHFAAAAVQRRHMRVPLITLAAYLLLAEPAAGGFGYRGSGFSAASSSPACRRQSAEAAPGTGRARTPWTSERDLEDHVDLRPVGVLAARQRHGRVAGCHASAPP
jgi:hypothetical protein